MSSVDSITITSVSTVNQIEITSTSGITVTTVGTQGLAGPSAIMQKGVDSTTIGSSGNGTFLVYDHANSQWTSSGSASVSNLTVEIQKLRLGGTGATVVSILDEDNMASNSATALATQQSIKAYVESRVGIDNLAALLASGNTTGGTNIVVSANDDITFTDSSKALFGNSSDLQVYHDGTNSYITNSQGALKIATESSGITVNIGHTTSTVAIGDDLTVAGNQSITGTLGVTGTITGSLTGNVTGQVSDISNFTTANITENTNLYYTNERVDDQVNSLLIGGTGITLTYDDNAGTLTIDGQIGDITSVLAGDGLSGGGSSGDVTLTVNVDNSSVEINSDTLRVKALGITNDMLAGSITNSKLANADFTINSNSLVLGNSLTLDTDDIGEGSNNQYYTTSRANSDFDTRLATKTTDNLTEGSSRLYFTTARANTSIDNRVTKAFVDNLGVEASSVTANSVALGTDTTGNYIQTVSGTANKITVTGSGSESADITLTLPDDVQIADSLTVAGNLTVNGTLTSLDTTNLDIEDNLFQLNAGLTGSPVNDSGMLINRGNQNNGIFMWDESVDKFTMGLTTADGSATGNITLASLGTLVVNVEGNLTGSVTGNSSTATTLQTPRSIALSGDVSASAVNFDGSGNITLTTTIEANSIALGTDTVGNYVASITGGTGVTITGGTGESSTPSVAIGQAVGTTDDVTFNQVTADIIGNIEGATEFSASAGEALSKGDAVYISGVSGNKPVVSKADSDDANKMPSFGLVKADANLNANVSVVTFGTLAGLNTSSFSVGDTLYISTTAGVLTATAPTGESSLIQNIGKVQRSHASSGSIKVGGAGRTNATPNLNDGKIFLGNGSNQSVSTTLDSSVVPENTNLYYTDARFDTRLATKDTGDISEGSNLYWTVSRVQAVSINNVVEDTTPQLGGDLASNGNDILFGDNDKAVFGTGSDLQIYHDGSNSYVTDAGTGDLRLSANNLRMQNADNSANYIKANNGSNVELYFNNSAKLATTNTGIDVTGNLQTTGYLAVNGTSGNTGSASDRWIGGDGTAGTWFYNVPTGSNHYFAVNNSNKLTINSSGIDVTGTATMDGLTVDGAVDMTSTLTVGGVVNLSNGSESAPALIFNSDADTGIFRGGSNTLVLTAGASNRFYVDPNTHLGTLTAGTSNLALGVNAGNSIASGGNYNVVVGDNAGTAITTGGSNVALGNNSLTTTTTASFNTAIGAASLQLNTTGSNNSATGYGALYSNTTASNNTANGYFALFANTTGASNTAVGYLALEDNTTGTNNVALGKDSLRTNTTSNGNVAVGSNSLELNTAANNTAVGNAALSANTTGTRNTALGSVALTTNTTGSYNTAIGGYSLYYNTTASNNTATGYLALHKTTTGANNTAIGKSALEENTTGAGNTAVGNQALDANTTAANNTAIGYLSLTTNTTGHSNVGVGAYSLYANTQSNRNTALGYNTLSSHNLTSDSNGYNTVVGFQAGADVTTGVQNTFIGGLSGDATTTASENVAVGYNSLGVNTTGAENTAVGTFALDANTTASNNTAVGNSALTTNTTGASNVGTGSYTLRLNTTGSNNTALGYAALDANTTASNNTAVGYGSLTANTTGESNVAVGSQCLDANTTGLNNTAVGRQALDNNTTGSQNVAVGTNALDANTTANSNTAVGTSALRANTTASGNVAVGFNAMQDGTTSANSTAVGYEALANVTTVNGNHAFGFRALKANTSGSGNTAVGGSSLAANTTGEGNTSVGGGALDANTTGSYNQAFGENCLTSNTTGAGNIAIGRDSMAACSTGARNTAIGAHGPGVNYGALYNLTTGTQNCAMGTGAGVLSTTGSNNVLLGFNAGSNITTGVNNICIGSSTQTQVAGSENNIVIGVGISGGENSQFRFGSSSNTVSNEFDTDAAWTRASDIRKKRNIKDDTLGLEFINDLSTKTFQWKPSNEFPKEWDDYNEENKMNLDAVMHGLIAQDVKSALDKQGVDTFGGWVEGKDGMQNVSREMFVTPLIKAVQELSTTVDELKAEIQTLKGE